MVLGIQTGTLIWGTLTSAGVTALLTASHLAYEVLRWTGAAYLVWMGIGLLRNRGGGAEPERLPTGGGVRSGWRRGTLTNLLNPKVGVFYVAVLPQFIPAGAPHFAAGVALTCVHVVEGLLWSAVLVGFARAVRGWLKCGPPRGAAGPGDGCGGGGLRGAAGALGVARPARCPTSPGWWRRMAGRAGAGLHGRRRSPSDGSSAWPSS